MLYSVCVFERVMTATAGKETTALHGQKWIGNVEVVKEHCCRSVSETTNPTSTFYKNSISPNLPTIHTRTTHIKIQEGRQQIPSLLNIFVIIYEDIVYAIDVFMMWGILTEDAHFEHIR